MVRTTKRIYPDEVSVKYVDGDYINFTLPQNIIDLKSLKLYFTGLADSVELYKNGTILKRFLPPNSSAIIDEIQIKRNGEIVQYIKEYALLHQMFQDMNDDYTNNSDSSKPDTLKCNRLNANNYEIVDDDITNTDVLPHYNYSISNWIGFLNTENKYLDCRGKQVQITIKLSPKYITYEGLKLIDTTNPVYTTYDTDYHYNISNVFLNMTLIHNKNIDLTNKIYFEDFTHFKGMKNTTSKNAIVKGRVNKNIKYVLSTFTDNTRNTDTGLQLQHMNLHTNKFGKLIKASNSSANVLNTAINDGQPTITSYSSSIGRLLNKPNQLNNSIYFKRNGIDIRTTSYRVNGVDVTPQYTALECFNNVKTTFNTQLKKVGNLSSFINDFFMNVLFYNAENNEISEVEWIIDSEGKNVGGEGH